MPSANETRVPVAVIDALQLLCAAALIVALAWGIPAVAYHILELDTITVETLFTAHIGSREVLLGTIVGTFLVLIQAFVIRDPARGTPHWKYGIAVSALGIVAGGAATYGAYRVGFVLPAPGFDMKPMFGSYFGIFAGVGFTSLGIVRLTRLLEAPRKATPPPNPLP